MNIKEHMPVIGADGQRIGTVDNLEGDRIKLTRHDSPDGQHHFISTDMVDSVDDGEVILTQTADETRAQWHPKSTETKDTSKAASQRLL